MAAVPADFQFGSASFICFVLVPANGNNETSVQNPAYHNDIKHNSAHFHIVLMQLTVNFPFHLLCSVINRAIARRILCGHAQFELNANLLDSHFKSHLCGQASKYLVHLITILFMLNQTCITSLCISYLLTRVLIPTVNNFS